MRDNRYLEPHKNSCTKSVKKVKDIVKARSTLAKTVLQDRKWRPCERDDNPQSESKRICLPLRGLGGSSRPIALHEELFEETTGITRGIIFSKEPRHEIYESADTGRGDTGRLF